VPTTLNSRFAIPADTGAEANPRAMAPAIAPATKGLNIPNFFILASHYV